MSLTAAQIDQLSGDELNARFLIGTQDFGLESREGWDSENPTDSWISWLLSLYPELEPNLPNDIPTYASTISQAQAGAIRVGFDPNENWTPEQTCRETLKVLL